MTLQDLANKYAYEVLTCPDSTSDFNSVLESWAAGKERDDVTVWRRFENCDPFELECEHSSFADSFLQFYAEATKLEKEGSSE